MFVWSVLQHPNNCAFVIFNLPFLYTKIRCMPFNGGTKVIYFSVKTAYPKLFFNIFYAFFYMSSTSKRNPSKIPSNPYSIPFATRNNAHSFQKHSFCLAITMSLHLKSTAIGTQKQCFYLQ